MAINKRKVIGNIGRMLTMRGPGLKKKEKGPPQVSGGPEAKIKPKALPDYASEFSPLHDLDAKTYTIDYPELNESRRYNLTPEENEFLKTREGRPSARTQEILDANERIKAYIEMKNAAADKARGIKEGALTTPGSRAGFDKMLAEAEKSKNEDILNAIKTAREQPREEFESRAANPLTALGFMASGAVGMPGVAAVGAASLKLAGMGTAAGVTGAAAASALAVPAVIGLTGGFMAYKTKLKIEDIGAAKQEVRDSKANIREIIRMADSGDYEEIDMINLMKKQVDDMYAAEAFLMKRSAFEVAFWLDSASNELQMIEDFKEMEGAIWQTFATALANPSGEFDASLFEDSGDKK